MNQDIRWEQRFDNFLRALQLLREAIPNVSALSELEQQGLVQRFEFTLELGWKTLKDYLIYQGVVLEQITPRAVIKQAFAAQIIQDGHLWIEMIDHRNLLSHTYDIAVFSKAALLIATRYYPAFEELETFLKKQR